ncbi:MAG: DUF1761 domain-containing protein [Rhodobacter sp.]|nr:DUF1761 domain-containing protein [Rhodobacter sp.]
MEILNVIAAGVAAWIFGAVWYMALSKSWMEASGLTPDSIDSKNPMPYVVSLIGAIVTAGMLRHVMEQAGIDTLLKALMTGVGLGLFVVVPWIANNVLYGQRDKRLIWMDGGYPAIGMTIMAVVLWAF